MDRKVGAAGRSGKLVADRFEAKFLYAIWFEPASNQLRTSSEPASVMEFGFYLHPEKDEKSAPMPHRPSPLEVC